MGAVTGAVSGGLGQVFSPAGFWGAVGNGALTGAGTGGITSIINGTNFFEGVLKGAVIGGAVAGISYTINHYANGNNKTKSFSKNDIADAGELKYDPNVSTEEMQKNVNTMRTKDYSPTEIKEFGVGTESIGTPDAQGYVNPGNGEQDFAYVGGKNFWTGKTDIIYAPIAAQNPRALALTMVHETGHTYFNALGLKSLNIDLKKYNISFSALGDTEHFSIYKLEVFSAAKSNIPKVGTKLNQVRLDRFFKVLGSAEQELINSTYNKLLPVFNRFLCY